jgi:glyoxylase-like metal-dependent hydrolase (beta-lactamase superfamily II)
VDFDHVFQLRRWRQRFKSEDAIRAVAVAAGQAPDATVDEVGSAPRPEGFKGTPLPGHTGNGQGSGDPAGPGWAGWGATS